MESMAYIASDKVDKLKIEEFHEFLRRYADIFNKNVTLTKGSTYKNLKNLISKNNIVFLKGDKDSSIVISEKKNYIVKFKDMIQDGIYKSTYNVTKEDTLKVQKRFQKFLRRNFKE